MNFLDTSFVLDYLSSDRGYVDDVEAYLEGHRNVPHGASTAVLFEVYRGAVWPQGTDELDRTKSALEWISPVPLTKEAVVEAACIDYELRSRGEQIGLFDTIIAGAAREAGGTLVSRDHGFARVADLDVIDYER